jgi:CheY-like chemotaxis protein
MSGIGFLRRLLASAGRDDASATQPPQAALGARMLVVDDSPTICAVLGKMLSVQGYAVSHVGDGQRAIELAICERPALIFLDIVMPGMNGFGVLRALRHDPLTAHIPIVMISGNAQATEQFYVQRFGADDFMKKPFGRDEVCRRIARLVQAGRLAARLPYETAKVTVLREWADGTLADIADIAMPDADPQHLAVPPARPRPGLRMTHGAC